MRPIAFVLLLAAACGGGKSKPAAPPPAPAPKAAPAPPPEPAAQEPPPAKTLHAKAALDPAKGAKQPAQTVSFTQIEGQDASVSAQLDGLKAGKYHLVVHDGEDCAKPGEPWKGTASVQLAVTIGKDGHGELDESAVKLELGGVAPVVGHVLVLHDDKKGKPNKVLACGPIESVGE